MEEILWVKEKLAEAKSSNCVSEHIPFDEKIRSVSCWRFRR